MAALVDRPVGYDLAESTCPPLRLGELLTPDVLRRLDHLEIGYGTTQGDPELRTLIAANTGVDADEVLVTAGGSAAMFLVAMVLCRPGEHAVLATPCFPPAATVLDALGARVTRVALSFEDGYRLDVDALAAAVTPSTRLVSLASPQNPSGICFTEREILDLATRIDAVAPDAVLLVDETYRETGYGDAPIRASMSRLAPRIVTCASLSKSHGAPGLRTGWLTTTDHALYEELRAAKFNALVSDSGVDTALATEVLRRGDRILAGRRAFLGGALDLVAGWADAHDSVEFLRPDGGALCCFRLRANDPALFYAALAERDTRVAPGSWFGESDRVFRVGFGHLALPVFEAGLERLADALAVT
jgi:aspartate/methionine/tyrosine aminotransferase